MKENEFESRLQRTPFRGPPREWREAILGTDAHTQTAAVREPTLAAAVQRRVRNLFWPHPVAWGALASTWLLIAVTHAVLRDPDPMVARVHIANVTGVPTVMEMQREMLASLSEPRQRPQPHSGQPLPPQSCIERRRETFTA